MTKSLEAAWAVGWRITTLLIIWGILLAPLWIPVTQWLESRPGDSLVARLCLELFAAGTIIIAAGSMLRFVDRIPFNHLGLTGPQALGAFFPGLALGAGMMAAGVFALWLLGVARVQVTSPLSGTVLALAGAVVFVNSVTQEVLVQGYILQTMERRLGSLRAVLLSAALFVAFHAPLVRAAWLAGVNIYLAGLLLGAAYVLSRSLWLPIGIHCGWNFVQGPLLGLNVSGHTLGGWRLLDLQGAPVVTGGSAGPEGGVMATVATLLGIAVLLTVRIRRRDPSRPMHLPAGGRLAEAFGLPLDRRK